MFWGYCDILFGYQDYLSSFIPRNSGANITGMKSRYYAITHGEEISNSSALGQHLCEGSRPKLTKYRARARVSMGVYCNTRARAKQGPTGGGAITGTVK